MHWPHSLTYKNSKVFTETLAILHINVSRYVADEKIGKPKICLSKYMNFFFRAILYK